MYSTTTKNIEVVVEPFYLDAESEPEAGRYFWAYRVTIANNGPSAVKLMARYWRITNGLGKVEEVRGDGVVGEQPVLEPGDSYQYTSGCPLSTSSGVMEGSYTMAAADNHRFEVAIPAFSLDLPNRSRTVN